MSAEGPIGDGASSLAGVGFSLAHSAETLGDLGPALDRFEALGLDAVEIFLPSLGVVLNGRVRRPALAELRRLCADRPFGFSLHGPLAGNLGDAAHDEAQRAATRAGLEVAAEIGAAVLVQHAPIAPSDAPDTVDATLGAEREALAALAETAAEARVTLCIETMWCQPGEWTAAPHELADQLAAVDSPWIAATLDFSHAALNAAARGIELLPSLEALAPRARHLHIHDSFARPAPFRPWSHGDALTFGFGDLHLPPGLGALPWRDFARLPFGGPAVANLELNQRWRADWDDAIAWTRSWIADARAHARTPAHP